ncbi:MAG: hypothetical protein ACRDGM_01020 [bacterium]
MKKLCALVFMLFSVPNVQAQTIEGFWQDIAGRTTFQRNVSPASVYGSWHDRALDATYPQAKLIRKTGAGFDLADLNYEEKEYSIRVLQSDASRIAFVRKASWSACRTEHDCRLDGNELSCSLQTLCQEAGKDVLDWQGDERYVRRTQCEQDGRVQLQGIPVKCR